ncbi:xylan 1,4-beta-xylosidase [Bailinhaonella thermotolerans]|uniref:Xylan 1,4-beta-xylosidase n=2 Tax=Bailinhaonella thermotolerans TaxID=1070861 RepID=A0A3A4B5G1_9ACTN|nr:xylan 1,4-beta-xylosidase [Bailinhaonella thermotolerans]
MCAIAIVAVLTAAAFVYVGDGAGGTEGDPGGPAPPPPSLAGPPEERRWPVWGVTHTQYSADGNRPRADGPARELLSAQPLVQNQHIMGWGALNPEPSPGRHDFKVLDQRLKLMADTGATPVITLCCAPDWMKGGRSGRTDWSKLEVAPLRRHFGDFARLAATVARRYPHVRHYLVWNEFKGFWNDEERRWDYEGYTELYNRVYTALKEVDPKIQVGGPYIPMDSSVTGDRSKVSGPWGSVDPRVVDAIEYWHRHKKGADFVAVDGSSVSEDRGAVPSDFGAVAKFGAITRWLRELTDLPVWWAEWYVEPTGAGWSEARRTAVHAAAMMEMAAGGVRAAPYWNPQTADGDSCHGCVWRPDTGEPMPMAALLREFARWFPDGTRLDDVEVSSRDVRALAQPRRLVVVNTRDAETRATVDGRDLTLAPYEIRWLPRTT